MAFPEITDQERARIRSQFPALGGDIAYLENAGGSQVPKVVADRISEYMLSSYVQLGAGYELSQRCTDLVDRAHGFVGRLLNARDGHVVLGSSTTSLLTMLAECYGKVLTAGDEIIVAENGHEANIGPWKKLEARDCVLRWWKVDRESFSCPISDLDELLSEKTALVAVPHVSNLLGDIDDVALIARKAHAVGARVVVDGVAFAPHRAMDVHAWDVDWYAYSTYKVYGPHMAALYGTQAAFAELAGPNHFFIEEDELPYKFELGGPSHEGCAGILGLADYLAFLSGVENGDEIDRLAIEKAFDLMTACELPLQRRLIAYLLSKPKAQIVGPAATDESRVGTISFVHSDKTSREITEVVDRSGTAIRHGHMYAYHLCEALGLEPEDGVIRVSLVHYNTPDEVERLIEVLDPEL
jgi:cysteine desulfurase family protein (TIGR01976 family)